VARPAHALAEDVNRGDALKNRHESVDDRPGHVGFAGQIKWLGDQPWDRSAFLDDTEVAHPLTGPPYASFVRVLFDGGCCVVRTIPAPAHHMSNE
jgi:hypothetical protein